MSEIQEILTMVRQDSVVELVGILLAVGIAVLVVCWPYKAPKWSNVKKPRVFRERF